jgi:plastocyanin
MRTTRPEVARCCYAVLALAALCIAPHGRAATLEVSVTDEDGRPVERVAVNVKALTPPATAPRTPTAVMDQHDHRFVPHMLIVQAGTSVLFPNNDDVSHHVYSFSKVKTFELGLYKGETHPPIDFNEPGIVVLGCNIHDGMLGYIWVVETPHFALTNDEGVALIDDLPDGEYALEVWTPRARPSGLPAAQRLAVGPGAVTTVSVAISGRLAPDHEHGASSLSWDRY